jgi:conserved repeat domain
VNTATGHSSTPVDPNAANDTGTATLTSSVIADLSLTKTPSVPVAATGAAFTWTVAVVNNGPSTALGASVTDAFPAPFTGVTWTCTPAADRDAHRRRAQDDRHDGRPPRRRERDVRATGLSAPVGGSPLANVATVAVAAGTTDPDLSNNSDTSAWDWCLWPTSR